MLQHGIMSFILLQLLECSKLYCCSPAVLQEYRGLPVCSRITTYSKLQPILDRAVSFSFNFFIFITEKPLGIIKEAFVSNIKINPPVEQIETPAQSSV